VLVVVDPDRQPIAERLEEWERALLEVLSAGEGHVYDRHAPARRRGRQVARLLDEEDVHGRFLTL
jgi:hypothetical protein